MRFIHERGKEVRIGNVGMVGVVVAVGVGVVVLAAAIVVATAVVNIFVVLKNENHSA